MKIIKKVNNNLEKIRSHKYIRIPLGILLLILGVIGGFLPIIQGWVFIVLGLAVLFGEEFTNLLEAKIKETKNKFNKRRSHHF